MLRRQACFPFILAASFLLAVSLTGCGDDAETVKEDAEATAGEIGEGVEEVVEEVKQQAGYFFTILELSTESCEDILGMSTREGEGYGVPGTSGAERWGVPEEPPATPRVRRSWSSLSDEEKKQVVDGFVKLKQTLAGSGAPGAERADYETFCEGEGSYTRNLHDFYVELHSSAYVSMKRDDQPMASMPHMGRSSCPGIATCCCVSRRTWQKSSAIPTSRSPTGIGRIAMPAPGTAPTPALSSSKPSSSALTEAVKRRGGP